MNKKGNERKAQTGRCLGNDYVWIEMKRYGESKTNPFQLNRNKANYIKEKVDEISNK